MQADSLPADPQGKPKNTGMGSLSLLQGFFLTWEMNQGLLYYRWILYQLSYQGIYYMCLVIQLCVTLCNHGPSFTRLLCPWGLFRPENWSGYPCPPPGHLPNTGIKPRPPALQADSLPSEPAGKPKNTGMGSLSLLQGIFLTQGSNPGLLHCRQILYRLSHQGSPISFRR